MVYTAELARILNSDQVAEVLYHTDQFLAAGRVFTDAAYICIGNIVTFFAETDIITHTLYPLCKHTGHLWLFFQQM
ncbi:hypothetical protein D3C86_1116970 [compost metagenome]